MKALLVVGTRPEAIKLAPVARALEATAPGSCRICSTGQHRELLDGALRLFGLAPHHELGVMKRGQSLHYVVGRIVERLGPVLEKERPDWVVVQGDTVSAAAGALAAFYAKVPIAHVEAGLRTPDKHCPFPEEADRRIVDLLADGYFAATAAARDNLLREKVPAGRIAVVGNPVVDAFQWALARPAPPQATALLKKLGRRKLILATAHRRESFGKPLERIFSALEILAKRKEAAVVFVAHPNPNVAAPARRLKGVTVVPSQAYDVMAHLIKASRMILTDSGGLQEEAPTAGVPVLVLRDVTDRPEAVEAGAALLVGTDPERIVSEATLLLGDAEWARRRPKKNPYGDGKAGERIARALLGK